MKLLESFRKNRKLYAMEAAGLGIFMISACLFSGLLWSDHSLADHWIKNNHTKFIVMGVMMGITALFIFYAPFTSQSGSHINPAVTLTFFRLGRIQRNDALYYIVFQFVGGTLAVYVMKWLMGSLLTDPSVNFAVTVPVMGGPVVALLVEVSIAFATMLMILFTSANKRWCRYTRIFSAGLVCVWVIVAGPVSGFGMNPARSLASALPANTWTSFWIYLVAPLTGMLGAAEFFLLIKGKSLNHFQCFHIRATPGNMQLSK